MNLRSKFVVISLSFVLVLAVSSAWASGQRQNGAAAKKPVHLALMIGQFNLYVQAQKEYMTTLISEFEKANPNIKVSYQTYASSGQENSSIQTSLATNQGPDVFDFGSSVLPSAYATGGFRTLSTADWNMLGGMNRFFKQTLTMSGPSPDKYIGVPEYIFPFVMIYNKKMFREAGIAKPPTTWTEFVNDAKKLTNPAKGVWGAVLDPSDSYTPWKFAWDYTRQLGDNFFSSDLKTARLDSPASVQSLTFWFDWITKYKIASPVDLSYKQPEEVSAFGNGKAAMLILGEASYLHALNKSSVKNDYALAPNPTIPYGMSSLPPNGVPVGTEVAGQYFAIPKYTSGSVSQAALKWLEFATAAPQQQLMYKTFGYLPANKKAYDNYPLLATAQNKAFAKAEETAYPTPYSGAFGYLEAAYGAASTKVANEIATNTYNSGDIASALKAANAAVQSNLQK